MSEPLKNNDETPLETDGNDDLLQEMLGFNNQMLSHDDS
jgi:hypothetical protein